MVKRLFFLAAGALALTACTSQDVMDDVDASRNLIKFENAINKHSRAATDLTTRTLNKFNVFGYYTMPDNATHAHAVFDNVLVSTNGNGFWSYSDDNKRYWVPGATYYFYAYSCGSVAGLSEDFGKFSLNMEGEEAVENRVLKITDYVCDNEHQHDLLFASNTGMVGKNDGNDVVSLQFSHVLSKIKARFTSKFSPEYKVVIKNVSVRNILNTGDFNFTTGWSDQSRPEGASPLVYLLNTDADASKVLEVKNEKVVVNEKETQASVTTDYAYVIPNKYTSEDVNIYFEIDVMYNNDKVMSKQLKATFAPDWAQGYSYVYNIEVSADNLNMNQITFNVNATINPWGPDSSKDLTIDK